MTPGKPNPQRFLGYPHPGCPAAIAGVVAFAVFVSTFAVAAAEPAPLLDDSDRALIARLGKDVVGAPIDPIDPAKLIEAFTKERTAEFLRLKDLGKTATVQVSIRSEKKLPAETDAFPHPLWALTVPGVIDEYIAREETGLYAPLLSLGNGKLALSYAPAQPTILLDAAPGQAKSLEVTASVHPADDLSTVKYSGQIRVTYTNKGSYRIKTPAGSFDGMVLRLDFQGKLGPATMNDSDLRIFSPEAGLVAITTHNRLRALLLMDRDEHITLLLAKPPAEN